MGEGSTKEVWVRKYDRQLGTFSRASGFPSCSRVHESSDFANLGKPKDETGFTGFSFRGEIPLKVKLGVYLVTHTRRASWDDATSGLVTIAARLCALSKSVADCTFGFASTIDHGSHRHVSSENLLLSDREYLGRRPHRHTRS